jgi:hypothetical protein
MTPALLQHLREMGIALPPPVAACYAPPQWKPTHPGEDPPF